MKETAEDIKQELDGYILEFSKNVLMLNKDGLNKLTSLVKMINKTSDLIKYCNNIIRLSDYHPGKSLLYECYTNIFKALLNISRMGYPSFKQKFYSDLNANFLVDAQ